MAKKSTAKPSLPPFPWPVEGRTRPDGPMAPLARPGIEPATIADGVEPDPRPVWRTRPPALIRALAPPRRAALADYADAAGRVASSGGTSDPAAVKSDSASTGPALSRLAAAEALARMEAALSGHRCQLTGAPAVSYTALARWVAVDGLGATEIARRAGVARPRRSHLARIGQAVLDMSGRLAGCCGYAA